MDYSGVVVHPAIVHLALLIGGEVHTSQGRPPAVTFDPDYEVERVQQMMMRLADPPTQLTIYCLLSWLLLFRRRIPDGLAAMSRAVEIVKQHGLGMTVDLENPAAPIQPDGPTEDVKELVSSLCELIYLDKAACIVLKSEPLLPKEYDRQVRYLPVRLTLASHPCLSPTSRDFAFSSPSQLYQPWLSRHCVVVIRCRSVYFLQEALRFSSMAGEVLSLRQEGFDSLPTTWSAEYWDTLNLVAQHIAAINVQILSYQTVADARECAALRVCLMIALAAQLEMHRIPGLRHMPSRMQVVSVTTDIIVHTKEIHDGEDILLDPILGVRPSLYLPSSLFCPSSLPSPSLSPFFLIAPRSACAYSLVHTRGTENADAHSSTHVPVTRVCCVIQSCWQIVAHALRDEKRAFLQMSTVGAGLNWTTAFKVMIDCAAKVGQRIPYLGQLYPLTISDDTHCSQSMPSNSSMTLRRASPHRLRNSCISRLCKFVCTKCPCSLHRKLCPSSCRSGTCSSSSNSRSSSNSMCSL